MRQVQHARLLVLLAGLAGPMGPLSAAGLVQTPAAPVAPPAAPPAAPAVPLTAPAASVSLGESSGVSQPRIEASEFAGILARTTARIALVDLKVARTPGQAEYELTRIMIEDALSRTPEDLDLLRLLAETCVQLGDETRAIKVTRLIHKLDPSDKVAEMTLISSTIAGMQTVGERVKALKTFVGPRGAGIDPGVRSRLSLDLALLAREQADSAGFSEALRQSLKLDPTNKEAAGLLHSVIMAGNASPREVVQSLLVIMAADPIDPAPSLSIARIMLEHGAAKGALRFYDLHNNMVAAGQERLSPDLVAERYVALWASSSPAKVVTEITQPFYVEKRNQRMDRETKRAANIPTEQWLDALLREVYRPSELVRAWTVAASADGNDVFTSLGLGELAQNAANFESNALNDQIRGEAMSADDAKKLVSNMQVDLLWVRCLTGQQTDEASKQVSALRVNPNVPDSVLARLEGWTKIREAEGLSPDELDADNKSERTKTLEDGEALLKRQAGRGDLLAELGLAAAQAVRGDRAAAAKHFAELSIKLRGTLAGAWAQSRAVSLAGAGSAPPARVTADAGELEAVASGVPEWLEAVATNPGKFVAFSMLPVEKDLKPFSKASVEIVIRNEAPIALAVGNERAINSRVLLTAEVTVGVKDSSPGAAEVVSLERRYFLAPGEEMRVQAWAEPGLSAWFAELNACDVMRLRWRAIQGFRMKREETWKGTTRKDTMTRVAGPFSLTADTPVVIRSAVPGCGEGKFDAGAIAKRLETGTTEELVVVIAAIRYRMARDEEANLPGFASSKSLSVVEKQAISNALANRYEKADSTERAMILLMMPSARFYRALLDFDAVLSGIAEPDARVLRYKMITRAVDKDDPVLAAGNASADPLTRAVASIMRKRLQAETPRTYSRMPSSGNFLTLD